MSRSQISPTREEKTGNREEFARIQVAISIAVFHFILEPVDEHIEYMSLFPF